MATPHYEAADYYDCNDCESELTHTTEDEALEAHLDEYEPGPTDQTPEGITKWLRDEVEQVTVYAFFRKEWPEEDREHTASLLAERLEDWAYEDLGGPDHDVFDQEEVTKAFKAALMKLEPDVWQCEQRTYRTYQDEQLVSKARELFPHWFEAEATQ